MKFRLKNFTGVDGANPQAGLTLSGTTLYGTTSAGGTSNGIVFKVNTDSTGYTILKSFAATSADFGGYHTNSGGAIPRAGLTISGSALYGTAWEGGGFGLGTVFKVNTDGTGFTVLKNFAYTNGAWPRSGLTLSGTVLYGTTAQGGGGTSIGTVFKMNTDGTGYTVLKTFLEHYDPISNDYTYSEGQYPDTALTLSGSTLYGTTANGGSFNLGTIFRVKTDGTGFAVLKRLTYYNDGIAPGDRDGTQPRDLTLADGVLYGTTYSSGAPDFGGAGSGTVFKLDLSAPLGVQLMGGATVLTWADPAFALQAAPAVTGIYTNIPGALSPHTNLVTNPQQFFRLKMN